MIDWKKVLLYTVLFLCIAAFWIWLSCGLASCSGCHSRESGNPEVLVRDTKVQKLIDSIDAVNALQKNIIDSLRDLSEQKNRRLRDLEITHKFTIEQLKSKPAKILYRETTRFIYGKDTSLSPTGRDGEGLYCYDSTGQVEISKAFATADNQKQVIEVYKQKDSLCSLRSLRLNNIINNQSEQLKLKDIQLKNKPAVVIKRKWYVDAGMVLGSIALGFTIKSFTK